MQPIQSLRVCGVLATVFLCLCPLEPVQAIDNTYLVVHVATKKQLSKCKNMSEIWQRGVPGGWVRGTSCLLFPWNQPTAAQVALHMQTYLDSDLKSCQGRAMWHHLQQVTYSALDCHFGATARKADAALGPLTTSILHWLQTCSCAWQSDCGTSIGLHGKPWN